MVYFEIEKLNNKHNVIFVGRDIKITSNTMIYHFSELYFHVGSARKSHVNVKKISQKNKTKQEEIQMMREEEC